MIALPGLYVPGPSVLSRGGRMFHYTGNLKSGEGNQVARGATRRMQEAGFVRVVPKPEAFGV